MAVRRAGLQHHQGRLNISFGLFAAVDNKGGQWKLDVLGADFCKARLSCHPMQTRRSDRAAAAGVSLGGVATFLTTVARNEK